MIPMGNKIERISGDNQPSLIAIDNSTAGGVKLDTQKLWQQPQQQRQVRMGDGVTFRAGQYRVETMSDQQGLATDGTVL